MSEKNILSWRCLRVAGRTTGITNGQIREPCLHMAMQTMNTGKSNLQGCRFLLFRSQMAWNRLFPVRGRHPAGIHRGHPACRISGVCSRNSRQKEFFLLYWNGIRCIFLLRSKRPFPSSMHIIEYRKEDVTAYAEYHCFRTRSADGECRRIFLSSWI